jgi:hypothetical protein
MRQKVVSHEEKHKHPIVDGPFEIEIELHSRDEEFGFEVFTEDFDVKPDERLGRFRRGFLIEFTRFFFWFT